MSAATWSSSSSDASFEHLLTTRLPDLLPDHPRVVAVSPIAAPGGHHPNVRRVTLSTGTRLVARRSLLDALAAGSASAESVPEDAIAEILLANACQVPAVVCRIADAGITVYTDVGTATLDDLIQTSSPVVRARTGRTVVESFLRIQNVLSADDRILEDWLLPGTDEQTVRDTFRGIASFIEARSLEELLLPDRDVTEVTEAIHALINRLADRPMRIGPTDYNARNIVVADSGEVFLLECGKLGYDWMERRLVQYATSLGSGRKGASPKSLIDVQAVAQYASMTAGGPVEDAAFALDAHHLVFHVLLAQRWTQDQGAPPRTVFEALSTPLSSDETMGKIRSSFRRR